MLQPTSWQFRLVQLIEETIREYLPWKNRNLVVVEELTEIDDPSVIVKYLIVDLNQTYTVKKKPVPTRTPNRNVIIIELDDQHYVKVVKQR